MTGIKDTTASPHLNALNQTKCKFWSALIKVLT
uniref:Uncharacterized protein n=1 Tax=Anguilla anguilla TaxID=7936 RepID=A0A0E9RWA5_ANGAN